MMSEWLAIPDLPARLQELLAQIPPGTVTTYGDLACSLGDVIAARWVAEELLTHHHTLNCRCHRVVRAGGALGLYGTDSIDTKRARISADDIPVLQGSVRRMTASTQVVEPASEWTVPRERIWSKFEGTSPLAGLKAFQDSVLPRLAFVPLLSPPKTFGALDVAYPEPGIARGAYVLLDAATLTPLWSHVITVPVAFPYITTYLTFRELPVLERLWKEVLSQKRQPDVVFIDGTGILHPRRAGIAATFGMFADVPTIGITKSHLVGKLAGPLAPPAVPIVDRDEVVGGAIPPASGTSKPIYVSPGNRITVQEAVDLTLGAFRDHRVPEPIFFADRLSKGRPI